MLTTYAGNPTNDGKQFWKGGGRFYQDCISWEIKRAASLDPGQKANSTATYPSGEDELR